MALQRQGETRAARTALVRALTLAAPMGYASIFLEDGAPMAALLREARASSSVPSYVDNLLAAFPERLEARDLRLVDAAQASNRGALWAPQASDLVEPLSARELEVLRLIASGKSNAEIAQVLVIALSTVKTHTNSIFGKLQVTSRTQAIARAREMQLL